MTTTTTTTTSVIPIQSSAGTLATCVALQLEQKVTQAVEKFVAMRNHSRMFVANIK